MLVRFNVANYLSFFELTEFNMVSGDVRTKKHHTQNINDLELLKFSLLYGANGAGKSNLITSIETLRRTIRQKRISHISEDAHRFDQEHMEKPTVFEIEFISKKGTPFIYGLSVMDDMIENEYLYISGLGKVKDKLVFDRQKIDNNKSKLELDKKYLKRKKDKDFLNVVQNSLLKNDQVALSEFLQFDEDLVEFVSILKEAHYWIIRNLRIIHPSSKPVGLLFNLSQYGEFLDFSNDLLSKIDLGIKALHIVDYSLDDFLGETDEDRKTRKRIVERLKDREFYPLAVDVIAVKQESNGASQYLIKKLVIEHKGKKKGVRFSYSEESDGTKRIIEYLSLIYEILNPEFSGVYLVDEIERSIHPHLLKELIKKLVNSTTLTGQLVFTTHESNLLDLDLFRQDEVWLTEKNNDGATSFAPLSDYKIRNDLDIRKGYLKGRFGAIPMLANLEDLNWYKYATD